jgi:hypothetical protein
VVEEHFVYMVMVEVIVVVDIVLLNVQTVVNTHLRLVKLVLIVAIKNLVIVWLNVHIVVIFKANPNPKMKI